MESCDGKSDSVSLGKRSLGKRSGFYRGAWAVTRENTRMSKKLEQVESKHGKLLSRQQEMMDKVFTLIMIEVWSINPELVVPWVEK